MENAAIARRLSWVGRRATVLALGTSMILGTGAFAPLAPSAHAEELQAARSGQQVAGNNGLDAAADGAAAAAGVASGSVAGDSATESTSEDVAATTDVEPTGSTADESVAVGDTVPAADPTSTLAGALATDSRVGAVTINRTNLSATPEYDTATYLEHFRIPVTHMESSRPPRDKPSDPVKLEWAFDDDYDTRYIANAPGPVTFTLGFDEAETFDRLIYKNNAFATTEGYPNKLRVFISQTGEEGSYEELTFLQSNATAEKVVFNFSQPVTAKFVRLAFEQSQADNIARASEFKFLRYDEVSAEVRDLFANADRTKLNDKYNSEDALRALEAKANEHPIKESLLGHIDRAWKVFRGEIRDIKATRSNITRNQGVDSESYRKAFKVPVARATSSLPGKAGNELEKAFDDDWSTRFISNGYVGNYTITMEFDEVETIDRLLYQHGHTSQWNWGYPEGLTLSFSETGYEGSFTNVSLNSTSYTQADVMFKLSEPVRAKVVKLVFTAAYGGFANFPPAANEIKILRYDELPVILDDLFTTSSSLELKDKYNSEEILTELQAKLDVHPNKDELADKLKRAWGVYRGEVVDQNDRRDWPVHVIQKTGPDTERINWLFYGDGYTYDQQDKFVKDITDRVTKLMQVEPYRSMAPYMNLYAMCVESNESGVSTKTATVIDDRDTFFKVTYIGTIVASPKNTRARELNKWFTENYLDEGAKLMHSTVLSNTNIYFGAGTDPSSASLAAGEMMVGHEAAHIFAGLADEYARDSWQRGDIGGTNLTSNGDPETVRWKPFLGHRGTTMVNMGGISNGRYCWKAKGDCLMNSYNTREFCEICRESVFRRLNNNLKKEERAPMYVAQPELTIVRTEQEKDAGTGTGVAATDNAGSAKTWDAGPVISEANIERANGRQLQYRTVVSNYRDTDQDVTLKLKITGADGRVKYEGEETSSVHPNTVIPANMYPQDKIDGVAIQDTRQAGAVSLTIVTPELTGLVEGDKIEASVWYDGKLMGTVGNPSWGTVRISYKLVDDAGNVVGEVPGYGVQENRCYAGQNELGDVPEIYGYSYAGSSLDEDAFLAEAGTVSNIERYYKVSSVMVTKRLVDDNGNTVDEKAERVAYGDTVTPQAGDFTVATGYRVVAPAGVTVGKEDVVLTYTYERDDDLYERHGNVAQGKKAGVFWAADGSVAPNDDGRPAAQAVDGVSNDINNYVGFGADNRNEPAYLQVDLGNVYQLQNADGGREGALKMWRYWADGRTYNATVIVVSKDGTFEEGDRTVIYNSDAEGSMGFGKGTESLYKETSAGKSIDLPDGDPVYARYVRVYMNGRVGGNTNHINELQVFGRLADIEDERANELAAAIEALSKKVESGLYQESTLVAARNVLEAARKQLAAGVTAEQVAAHKKRLAGAEAKMRLKDTSEGSIEFLGGGLRFGGDVSERLDGLRLGFVFAAPEGAVIDWGKTGWYYGVNSVVGERLKAATKQVDLGDGRHLANFVVTGIGSGNYGTVVCARATMTYELDGEVRTITSDVVNARSVNGVAGKISAASGATGEERSLAQAILGR